MRRRIVRASGIRGRGSKLNTWGDFRPEPDNPHDPDAIAIHIAGERIGHLAREVVPRYRAVAR